jgi:putative protease
MDIIKNIELLSPAKNSEYGKIAINFGADAVYIGAPKFSARSSAGNSIQDIEKLCNYAHKFHSKVYVALNTILYESELAETEKLISEIYSSGADALIIQDMGILEMSLPNIPLHASTQTHNTKIEKVNFLENIGFSRVVLARELSLNQINEIKSKTNIDLEVFVHGALCVSYSGQCYMSNYLGGRSGNRGECAQPCRLAYDLFDKNNNILLKNKHLLSLKDMNRADYLANLIDSGVTSFKIEGRMKDENYLKNITAYYRKEIDKILKNKTEYKTSSLGKFYFDFEPDTEKTFNRQYSDYFLNGRKENIHSLNSPKAIGKPLGKVSLVTQNYFQIETEQQINNGDGLCFFNENSELIGLRVEKNIDKKIFTNQISEIKKGYEIFRNLDHEFIKKLSNTDNCRFIPVNLTFSENETGFYLNAETCDNIYSVTQNIETEKQPANNPEKAFENIKTQLNKTGGTIYKINELRIDFETPYFIQTSKLNELRRNVLTELFDKLGSDYIRKEINFSPNDFPYFEKEVDYKTNISNSLSEKFYQRHRVEKIEKAFEISGNHENKELMTTKLCIKYNLGLCEKYQNPEKSEKPQYLQYNEQKFELEFDCKNCEMKVKS